MVIAAASQEIEQLKKDTNPSDPFRPVDPLHGRNEGLNLPLARKTHPAAATFQQGIDPPQLGELRQMHGEQPLRKIEHLAKRRRTVRSGTQMQMRNPAPDKRQRPGCIRGAPAAHELDPRSGDHMDQLILRMVMQRSLEGELRKMGDRQPFGCRHHPMDDSLFHIGTWANRAPQCANIP